MGFNSERFISTRYFSSTLFSPSSSALFLPTNISSPQNRRNKRNKSGVDEKKKTQGMRRNLGHKGCGWVNCTGNYK